MPPTATTNHQPASPDTELSPIDPLYLTVQHFLFREAECLDERRFDEWLQLLTDDMTYSMPARSTLHHHDGAGFGPAEGGLFDEDRGTLARRLRKPTISAGAWAEEPPSRSRRFVSNIRVWRSGPDTLLAKSYVLLTTFRGAQTEPFIVVAERQDTLVQHGDTFKVKRRVVLTDQTSIHSTSLQLPL
jgi:3-phenylpropionate/cinnamic acid dioxygenase small subunit